MKLLILCGGRSGEHEVSLVSARFVIESLDRSRFEPLIVAIDKDGTWRRIAEHQLPAAGKGPGEAAIAGGGQRAWIEPMPAEGEPAGRLHLEGGATEAFDVAFPVLHGPYGEDGCIQGLFELAAVPYVGAGVAASAVGMDKALQKRVFAQEGLPVAPHRVVTRAALLRARDEEIDACAALGFPLFVKPANMGSSVGISKVRARGELGPAIDEALGYDTTLVVEQGIEGAREIEVSLLGNDEVAVSLPGEIVVQHPDGFYSYDAKYIDAQGARLTVPAELPADVGRELERIAVTAYRALGCSGMARADVFVSGRAIYLNELNTIPGFTAISMYPLLWRASGVDGTELVSRLIDLAFERHATRKALRTTRGRSGS